MKPIPILPAALLLLLLSSLMPLPALAQTQLSLRAASQSPAENRQPTLRQSPLSSVVKTMSLASGATILCESSIASALVAAPEQATTAANFENQIDVLVTRLPKGTTWAKLYMPDVPQPAATKTTATVTAAPGTASPYRADALVGYAYAAADLFGERIGEALPPGTIEVLGRKLSADKAAAVAAALDLKPVYVIVGSVGRRGSVDGHVQAILAMRPEDRSAVMAQLSAPSWGASSQMASLLQAFTADNAARVITYVQVQPPLAVPATDTRDSQGNGPGSPPAEQQP